MKILCISDQIDPLIYNTEARNNFPDIDLILCAGDLPMDYVEFVVSTFNKPVYFIFGNHDLKDFKFYHGEGRKTAGDFNSIEDKITHGAVYAGFKVLSLDEFSVPHPQKNKKTPLLIAGISGSKKYNNGLAQYTDAQMKRKLLKLVPKLILNKIRYGRYLDIFLTHATPSHVHDHEDPCHQGFPCFNWFLKKFKPVYMIHGHIHLYDQRDQRISLYEETTVVNAYAHYLLDFNTLSDITRKNSTKGN